MRGGSTNSNQGVEATIRALITPQVGAKHFNLSHPTTISQIRFLGLWDFLDSVSAVMTWLLYPVIRFKGNCVLC